MSRYGSEKGNFDAVLPEPRLDVILSQKRRKIYPNLT
jgi:hypothetical protein